MNNITPKLMSNKKQTAMQDLKQDLIHAIDTAKDALEEIESETTRTACQEVVRLTLKNIIQRIDDELLELEKQQIIDACYFAYNEGCSYMTDGKTEYESFEQYYTETYEN